MKCYSYVRFSSKAQASGKSLERQFEYARKFAREKGWELDESMSMADLGLSAFHGAHKDKALGTFLQAVQEGKIETPSALLVESLDRLSRQRVRDALTQFMDIINAGITVVSEQRAIERAREMIDNEIAFADVE